MKKIALLVLAALPLFLVLISYSAAQGPAGKGAVEGRTPDFIINTDRSTIAAPPGSTVKFDLWITPVNGFRGVVELSCTSSSPKITCELPVQTIKVGADLVTPFSVTAVAYPGTPYGNYPMVVNARGTYSSKLGSGSTAHTYMLHLAVVPNTPHP